MGKLLSQPTPKVFDNARDRSICLVLFEENKLNQVKPTATQIAKQLALPSGAYITTNLMRLRQLGFVDYTQNQYFLTPEGVNDLSRWYEQSPKELLSILKQNS